MRRPISMRRLDPIRRLTRNYGPRDPGGGIRPSWLVLGLLAISVAIAVAAVALAGLLVDPDPPPPPQISTETGRPPGLVYLGEVGDGSQPADLYRYRDGDRVCYVAYRPALTSGIALTCVLDPLEAPAETIPIPAVDAAAQR
jgi:hypothetical protein